MDKERAIDLLDNLIGMVEDNQENDYDGALRMAIEVLRQSERKTGHWVSQKGGGYCCSECGRYALDEVDGNFIHVAFESNFCPYCGAKMKGELDEQ